MDRGRLEAFSDGVMAVAITLLALNLAVAGPGHGPLLSQLGQRWPSFVAYLVSFLTIGIIWVNHHELVKSFVVVDRMLLFLNLLLLLFVVALPFGTSTMATYLASGGQDARVAMALYIAIFEGMALSFTAIFAWSLGEKRTARPIPPHARRSAWLRFSFGALVYVAAFAIAFISPLLALAIVGLVAVYYVFERTPAATHSGRES